MPRKAKEKTEDQSPTDVIKEMIAKAKTAPDIRKCEDKAIKLFPDGIPEELSGLAEAKYKEIVNSNMKPKKVKTGEWVEMTDEEKDKHEKAGRLVGWNNKKKIGLLKEDD